MQTTLPQSSSTQTTARTTSSSTRQWTKPTSGTVTYVPSRTRSMSPGTSRTVTDVTLSTSSMSPGTSPFSSTLPVPVTGTSPSPGIEMCESCLELSIEEKEPTVNWTVSFIVKASSSDGVILYTGGDEKVFFFSVLLRIFLWPSLIV